MTLSQEIADAFHLRIWVGDDSAKANQQGIKRDIKEYGLEEQTVLEAWKEWREWETRCLNREDRRERADFIV
jgi:hypothetical protein